MALIALSNIVAHTNKLQLVNMSDLNFMGQGFITTDDFITKFGAQFGIGHYVYKSVYILC